MHVNKIYEFGHMPNEKNHNWGYQIALGSLGIATWALTDLFWTVYGQNGILFALLDCLDLDLGKDLRQ